MAETTESVVLPSFSSSPIAEVAIGCHFEPLTSLKLPHIGLVLANFLQEFPKFEHAHTIVNLAGEAPVDSTTGLPLPRVWLINEVESRLLQFQGDIFYLNWRKNEKEGKYPRFPILSQKYFEYFRQLETEVNRLGLGPVMPSLYDISYTNHIDKKMGIDSEAEFPQFFTDFEWGGREGRYLAPPITANWSATYAMPNDMGRVSAKRSSAKRQADGADIFVFEISAKYKVKSSEEVSMKEWFAIAHEVCVKTFADLTSTHAHRAWGKVT